MPNLPASLETIAADLASSLEGYVQTIVDAAENRANEIAREAEQAAIQKEGDSERRAEEILEAVVTRTSRLLGSIELVESSLRGMIGGLRAELETMTADLAQHGTVIDAGGERAREPSLDLQPPSPVRKSEEGAAPSTEEPAMPPIAPGPDPERQAGAPQPSEVNPIPSISPETGRPPDAAQSDRDAPVVNESASTTPDEGPSTKVNQAAPSPTSGTAVIQDDTPSGAAAEFDRMIQDKTKEMIESGKSRREVERFLGRFKRGKQYIDHLDGMLTQDASRTPPRQSGLRRLFRRR